jgi:hypothetical protein
VIRRTLLAAVVLAAALTFAPSRAQDKKGETVELFNGKNLDGWKVFLDPKVKDAKPEETWRVEKGVIHCKGMPRGYILTEKEYSDYVLEVEWRWPEAGGNSGVFVHVIGEDKVWPKAVEAQLASGSAGDFWLVDEFKLKIDAARQDPDPKRARHYFRIKTDKMVEKPIGEWNQYRITCKGDTVKLEVNGLVVNEGSGAEATKGRILLQSEGTPIQFRNVKLTPLK